VNTTWSGAAQVATLALAVGGSALSAADIYVSPTGRDADPGTRARPFQTLERARDAAARIVRNGSLKPGQELRIILRGGIYRRTKPFVLGPSHGAPPGAKIVYQGFPSETATVTGAREISGWRPMVAGTPGLKPEAKGHVWEARIAKGWRFHYFTVDGKPQPVARLVKSDNWTTWPKPVKVGTVEPKGQLLTLSPGQLDGLPNNGDVEMNLMPVNFWNSLSVLRDINPVANTARRHSKSPTQCDKKDRFADSAGNYNLQNALPFLTQPGEWCVDSSAGVVYYWPLDGTMKGKKAWAPAAYRLVEVASVKRGSPVSGLAFRGITFTCTDRLPEDQWPENWIKRQAELPDAMLTFDGATNCSVEGCTFLYSGSYSVALMNRTSRVKVVGNDMGYSGCGGVLMQGFGPGTEDVNHSNTIRRNHIHHTGNGGYMHSAAVTLYQSGDNDISLNWIDSVPYVGIQIAGCRPDEFGPGTLDGSAIWDSYGGNQAMYGVRWSELPKGRGSAFTRQSFKAYLQSSNNRIRRNVLTDYMNRLHDGGALYCWGCGMGNVWEGNVLRREKTTEGEVWCFALYMDDFVDGAVLKNNIAWHRGPATINKGENSWEGNVVSADKPAGFDDRLAEIMAEARKEGGWLGRGSASNPGK
jgi:hypothetical protein